MSAGRYFSKAAISGALVEVWPPTMAPSLVAAISSLLDGLLQMLAQIARSDMPVYDQPGSTSPERDFHAADSAAAEEVPHDAACLLSTGIMPALGRRVQPVPTAASPGPHKQYDAPQYAGCAASGPTSIDEACAALKPAAGPACASLSRKQSLTDDSAVIEGRSTEADGSPGNNHVEGLQASSDTQLPHSKGSEAGPWSCLA